MLSIENICPNCGATIFEGDKYCCTCYKDFEGEQEGAMLEGIEKSEWHLFIDKNASRYVEVFSENKGKRIFFHMNWAAMFFSFYWMFYRKMYKYACLFLLVSTVLSIALAALGAAIIRPDMLKVEQLMEPYMEYVENNDDLYDDIINGVIDIDEARTTINEYNAAKRSIMGRYAFIVLVPAMLFSVLFGLLADCIYRRYILKNIRYKNGGTSGWALVGGLIIYSLSNQLIASPLITLIVSAILL